MGYLIVLIIGFAIGWLVFERPEVAKDIRDSFVRWVKKQLKKVDSET